MNMPGQFQCKNEKRRRLVRSQTALNGIDFLEVSLDQKKLFLYFIHNLSHVATDQNPEDAVLTEKNILIEGGERVWDVRALSTKPEGNILEIEVNKPGDFSIYRLRLIKSSQDRSCPAGFDPQLCQIDFSFKARCPGEPERILSAGVQTEQENEPEIDYECKDYSSFRRLMLDRLSAIMPQWKEGHPSDIMVAIVEILAYAGDYLSYYQDAVACEAYLETARKRYSVRRHARMLDYFIDEGCNSRLWACFEVEGAEGNRQEAELIHLRKGDRLLAGCGTEETVILPDPTDRWKKLAVSSGSMVFEMMHDLEVRQAHNKILFYTWSEDMYTLHKGSTSATLCDSDEMNKKLHLKAGEVLIFEDTKGTEESQDPDPAHRHAVRLTQVRRLADPLNGQPVIEIDWHQEDALPWDMPISIYIDGMLRKDIFCVRGNVALADQGRTIERETIIPSTVPQNGAYRPSLLHKDITFSTIYDHKKARNQSATSSLIQKSYTAVPAAKLEDEGLEWTARPDLLNSGPFSPHFAVEMGDDGTAYLRFGDDILGRTPSPGSVLQATYRVGNGTEGNVGPDSITHIAPRWVSEESWPRSLRITRVRNPISAQGGTDRESTDQVRFYAPYTYKRNERGVTEEDYALLARRHPGVNNAVATLRWTGSWQTMFVAVDRKDSQAVDQEFKKDLRLFLEQFRLAGHDIEIEGPNFVPLHIAFTVYVKPNYLPEDVRNSLLRLFSRGILPDGQRGFFHPDNFTFGQPVILGQIINLAMGVAGVSWIDASDKKGHHFNRWGKTSKSEIQKGIILLGRLEIARLDNDPNAPENGKIEFIMEGGL